MIPNTAPRAAGLTPAGRVLSLAILIILSFVSLTFGQTDEPKQDYSKLAAAIHAMVVSKAPKVHEDTKDWGQTIPFAPDTIRFPRLPRARTMVNGRIEVPHGLWKRYKAWIDDPAKDIRLTVREFKIEGAKVKLSLDAVADIHGEVDVKPWQKGLPLPGGYARADARVFLGLECNAKVALDFKKFPPDATVEPKIEKATIELQEFELLKVANRIVAVEGEPVRDLGRELKGFLQDTVKKYEPQVVEQLNQAIAKSLKDGKATIPSADWLKLIGGAKK